MRYSSPSDPRKGQLTDSVLKLKDKEKGIEELEGLTVATHRMSIFKALLESADPGGRVVASAGGFTNTLRLKHRSPIVNLPKVGSPWGEEIRGCIIAPEGMTVCGADVVSLEDMTKRHYMKPLDPTYVEEMDVEGFDPHVKLLVVAGKITPEDYDFSFHRMSQRPASFPELQRIRRRWSDPALFAPRPPRQRFRIHHPQGTA